MRIWNKAIAISIVAVLLAAVGAAGAEGAKIGLVDFQRILDHSKAGKAAQAFINEEGKKMEADLKTKGAEIEAMQKRMEQEKMVTSKEALEERGRELRIRVNDFKVLQQKFSKQVRELQLKAMERIKKDVFGLVEGIGKKEGYHLIVERQEGGVLYFPATVDLTDRLIKLYDAKAPEKENAKK